MGWDVLDYSGLGYEQYRAVENEVMNHWVT
jgi:hypothetical protein